MCLNLCLASRIFKIKLLVTVLLVTTALLSENVIAASLISTANQPQSKNLTVRLRSTLPATDKKTPTALITFSPDGRTVAIANGKEVKLYDAATGKLKATLTADKRGLDGFSFSPDGQVAATRDLADRKVKLWNIETGALLRSFEGIHSQVDKIKATQGRQTIIIFPVVFSPDGQLILTERNDDTVSVWETSTGNLKATLEHNTQSNALKDTLNAVSIFTGKMYTLFLREMFSPDGQIIATFNGDRAPKLWDTATGKLRATLSGHTDRVYGLVFSKDGMTVATISLNRELKLWDSQTGQLKSTFGGHDSKTMGLMLNSDTPMAAFTKTDGDIQIQDLVTNKIKATLNERKATGVVFSSDGRWIVTGRLNDAYPSKLWNAETGELMASLTDQKEKLERVEVSPDGNVLVTATNKTVKLWNPNNGQLLAVLDGARSAAQFSPDGKTLATGGEMNVTMLWDCLPAH